MKIIDDVVEFLDKINELGEYRGGTFKIEHIVHKNKGPFLILSYVDTEGNTHMQGRSYGDGEFTYSIGPCICNGCTRLVFDRIEFTNKEDLENKLDLDFIGGFEMNRIFCTKCMNRIESDEDIINKIAP